MANINFNTEGVPESEDYSPLPAGTYPMQVIESEVCDTKAGTGKYVKLVWEILDGYEYGGRKIYANYNIQNPNPKAQEIGEKQLADVCRAMGLNAVQDTEELHARPVMGKVKVEPGKGGYGPSNRITKCEPMNAAAPPAPQQPQQPHPPATAKPVWQQPR